MVSVPSRRSTTRGTPATKGKTDMKWLIIEKIKSVSEMIINWLIIITLSLTIIGLLAMITFLRDANESEKIKPKVGILEPDSLGSINGIGGAVRISPRPQPKGVVPTIQNKNNHTKKRFNYMNFQLRQSPLLKQPNYDSVKIGK
jgi:hypothetical protein